MTIKIYRIITRAIGCILGGAALSLMYSLFFMLKVHVFGLIAAGVMFLTAWVLLCFALFQDIIEEHLKYK